MTANFAGAFLGIVVTFGTTALIDMHTRRNMARKAEVIAIAHLDGDIMEMEAKFEEMRSLDSMYDRAVALYPDRIDELGSDTLTTLLSSIMQPYYFLSNRSAENVFTGSMETWRDFSDLNLLYSINSCFSLKNTIEEFYRTVAEYHDAAFDKTFGQQVPGRKRSPAEILRDYIGHPTTRNFLRVHKLYAILLPQLTAMLKEENDANKGKTGITDIELHALFPDIYGEDEEDEAYDG